MNVLRIAIFSAILAILISCSTVGSDSQLDYGGKAKQAPNLEIPPDLTAPDNSDQRYKIPEGQGGSATYSDFSKGGAAQGRGAGAILPEVPRVRMEGNCNQRWLSVNEPPEKVWAVTRAFLLGLGLTIKSEDPAAGVMETDWAENRAKIPQSVIRDVIGKVFNQLYSSGERDQYLVRLGRSSNGATEVHITHRGMVETFSSDMTVSKWQMRPNEPELEAIMLQRLMVRFGASEAQAASAVAATATAAASAVPPAAVSEPAGTASLREVANGGVVIVMNDPFDRSWRKVGLAIEAAGLAVEDRNRVTGTYFLRPIKIEKGWLDTLKFWQSDEDTEHQYRVNVKDGGATCEVSVTDQSGASNTATRQMTEAIYKHINQ